MMHSLVKSKLIAMSGDSKIVFSYEIALHLDTEKGSYQVHRVNCTVGQTLRSMNSIQQTESSLLKPAVTLTGTAEEGAFGPPLGLVDIGESENAYIFRVALPGVRSNRCQLKFDIRLDGRVHIEGVNKESDLLKTSSKAYGLKVQQLCPPGPFSISFNLPGKVDPRLCSPSFRPNGILEVIVLKHRIPCISAEGMFEKWLDSPPPYSRDL